MKVTNWMTIDNARAKFQKSSNENKIHKTKKKKKQINPWNKKGSIGVCPWSLIKVLWNWNGKHLNYLAC